MYYLVKDQDMQRQLREEIDEVTPDIKYWDLSQAI